jgi:hypothetical protein
MSQKRKSSRKGGRWIQKASARMKAKGTKGAFGKATSKKIAKAKAKGGLAKKRAVFAQNMKKIAAKRHHRGRKTAKR